MPALVTQNWVSVQRRRTDSGWSAHTLGVERYTEVTLRFIPRFRHHGSVRIQYNGGKAKQTRFLFTAAWKMTCKFRWRQWFFSALFVGVSNGWLSTVGRRSWTVFFFVSFQWLAHLGDVASDIFCHLAPARCVICVGMLYFHSHTPQPVTCGYVSKRLGTELWKPDYLIRLICQNSKRSKTVQAVAFSRWAT